MERLTWYRKLTLYVLRFVFAIGYAFGLESCFYRLEDIHDALDDDLIEELRESWQYYQDHPEDIRHL
jgi:hypothetical protein